ncbi:LacI family DNA-binding transcriptional regulator [Paenibacillus aurantius]|uniref:LacI family DNA-binding transcriptional regulator n=1 Tax=Paenibacillus aurantius TaxID=2918900 RepID=A0AA96RCJ0_9BACL|nr:LacI family DNA-binding transcriptional regulator [Paenibacillus aurantius]WNQ10600.1 LacI family DNA-binding transcriptional regulator [Paenibacillus aurantius]
MAKITMQMIADKLGLSKYTVSQALSGKPGVGRDKRQQILETARTLGYRLPSAPPGTPGAPGSGLPETKKRKLLLHMDPVYRIENDFWRRVLDGILQACEESGWEAAFVEEAEEAEQVREAEEVKVAEEEKEEKEEKEVEMILDDKWAKDSRNGMAAKEGARKAKTAEEVVRAPLAAGLIVVGKTAPSRLVGFRRLGLPLVLIDHEEPLVEADVILNANLEAARIACRHLLAAGCRSLVFVGRDSFSVSFRERWWGCRLAVDEWRAETRDSGLRLKKWTVPYGGSGWQNQLGRRLEALGPAVLTAAGEAPDDAGNRSALSGGEGERPDGFLCANDQIALDLIGQLKRAGLRVPEDCRVAGIDNIAKAAHAVPALTTVELAKEALGRRAVQALERKLANPGSWAEKIILSARLVERQSG